MVKSLSTEEYDEDYDTALESDLPVGEILRRTRIHYKQSIADVESALRIRAIQIQAIESGDLKLLPGRVYAIGFVRSYSEYLGLDSQKMVEMFKAQFAGKSSSPELIFPVAASDAQSPSLKVILFAFVIIIGVVVAWAFMNGNHRQLMQTIPPAPVVGEPPQIKTGENFPAQNQSAGQPSEEISSLEIQGPPAPDLPQTQDPRKEGIILNIIENSWVEIKDQSGMSILSRVLQAGDLYFVPDRPDLNISLGNAGGVRIEIDGKALRPLGAVGEVRRAIPLDMEYLKKTYAVDSVPASANQNSVENPQ